MMTRRSQAEAERRHAGLVASPGLACGPLLVLPAEPPRPAVGVCTVRGEERQRLLRGVHVAARQLADLCEGLDEDASGIVEFQIAMLEDESFLAPALAGVEAGRAAMEAWDAALAEAVAAYELADDAYFRARAADLADMHDRVAHAMAGTRTLAIPEGSIVAARDLSPTMFLGTRWSGGGIALAQGSATSHVAMLARARGVPMLVGLGELPDPAGVALLDAENGCLILAPGPATIEEFERRRRHAELQNEVDSSYLLRPAATARGEVIRVGVNLAAADDTVTIDAASCDGSGLVRTEFLFEYEGGLPDEEAQLAAYRRIVRWAGGRPVTFRTLDAGGDKPVAGLTDAHEANPFLGVRGIRQSLRRPEVFAVQLRALLRAAADGPVRIMLPMVTEPEEVAAARQLLVSCRGELARSGTATGAPPLGIMIEVPAAAIAVDMFDVDFMSIGSNDLTQYVTAAARDNPAVQGLARPDNPAVLRLIEHVAGHAAAKGIEVGVCGDMAGDPRYIPLLLERGIRSLSVPPAALASAKATIARWDGG